MWWSAILPSLIGFLGVLVGAFMVRGNERGLRRLDFVDKQLPIPHSTAFGRKSVRSARLRVRIQGAADSAWRELCAEHAPGSAPDHAPFAKIIEYENDQLKAVLLPAYEKMLQILRDNFYLAEESTRQYLPTLIEYLEVWRRHQKDSIPGEVIRKLGHTEQQLHPFYADIEATFTRLRQTLASGYVSSPLVSRLANLLKRGPSPPANVSR